MPPRARRLRASAPGPGPAPALGPALPPAPPPAVQQHPFVPPPPPFQPLHAGAYPAPGGNGQYHPAGLDMNAPPLYGQPYGAQPYGAQPYGAQPYGMPLQPYGAPLGYHPLPPHFASYPGVGNTHLQPWGYGHYPTGQLPNPVPHPVATRPDEWAEARDRAAIVPGVEVVESDAPRTVTTMRKDKGKSTAVQQKKKYLNREVSEGVWQFRVEVDRDQVRQTFAAQTDMTWLEFEAEAFERFNSRVDEDVRLGYRISGGNRTWVPLTCPSDWKGAVAIVREKVLVARTRAVSMEIRDVSTLNRPKAQKKGKGKEKRSRDDDIPPEATPEAKCQDDHLLSLQRHLLCDEHSKAARLRKYCYIEPVRAGVEGGHIPIEHREMTIWAKFISIGRAFKHLRPNIKPCDRPPAKRPRGGKAAPEVHIAVNITPTQGVGASQSTYVVSGAQVQLGPGSDPSRATQASGVTVHTEAPAPTPMENGSPSPPAYDSRQLLSDCRTQGRVPLVYEVLSLMDAEEPVPNLTYLDSHTDLYNFGAIQLFALDESLLSGFGLGTENARRIHRFIQEKFFKPLGLMDTASHVPPSTEVQDSVRHDDGVKGQAIKEEETGVVWLTIPEEIVDISDEDGIDEDEIDEDELDLEDNSVESDIASVTSV
ncbi:hypothetical protein EDB85DRAFT_1888122 [Lactarius pseudohatsudake]|nr:hypothetical protein EDB85DRAFT_1888122 [Lactarius pseudohatsudake]